MSEQGFAAPEVCKIVGISYRQLDYWDRTELLAPSLRVASGSGTQRRYSFEDLVRLKVIKKLLDTGVSLQRIRRVAAHLRSIDRSLSGVTLMSDGKNVYEAHSPDAIVDLLKQGQGVFAIAVDRVWDDVEVTLAKKASRSVRRKAAAGGS
jgi:DNA-binding transcriptional MerR regulator